MLCGLYPVVIVQMKKHNSNAKSETVDIITGWEKTQNNGNMGNQSRFAGAEPLMVFKWHMKTTLPLQLFSSFQTHYKAGLGC